MTDGGERELPDIYVCVLRASNVNIILAAHDTIPDFAWFAAERLSGMKERQLRSIGYEVLPAKLTYIEED